MKRKKGASGSSKKIKRNDLLFSVDLDSPSISIEEESNTGQIDELEVEQVAISDNNMIKTSNSDLDATVFKSAIKEHNRVKVKLKTSKLLEPLKHTSDVQIPIVNTPSDTEKSNSQFVMETSFGMIDATCSDNQTFEAGNLVPENPRRKSGSIKIKPSSGSGLSDFSMNQIEQKNPHNGLCYNSKDLNSALSVIKKVMKMDAAGPFNAPVNPVALGIPDYFEIIDTPMDFGSICHELEHGSKYKNSLNVYNDVQYIWDNCYKYNNKGDYILELMKRVKKNFMKYWTTAGLLTITAIPAGTLVEYPLRTHQDKSTSKMKSKHKRRRHGIDGHKSNCLCAVCVVRRRRREREEHSAELENHRIINPTSFSCEPKLEISSTENPCSEATASSFDHSPQTEADAEMDEAEKVDATVVTGRETELYIDAPKDESPLCENGNQDKHFFAQEWHHSSSSKHGNEREDKDDEIQGDNANDETMKPKENSFRQENHSALWLCKTLFPGSQRSVWNGPHSFNRKQATGRQHKNPMQSALTTLMHL